MAARLEIMDVLEKFPYQVSGGQKQRAACARAMVAGQSLLLADEPTGALDSKASKNLLEIMTRMNRDMGATILMVTHDAYSASYAARVLLSEGRPAVPRTAPRSGGVRFFTMRSWTCWLCWG